MDQYFWDPAYSFYTAGLKKLFSFLTGELTCLSHHVLLSDVALYIAVGVFVLEELGEGGVLGISIQSHHMIVVTAQLGKSHTVCLPCSNLVIERQKDNRPITY